VTDGQARIAELEARLVREQDIRAGLFRTIETLGTALLCAQELEHTIRKVGDLGALRSIDVPGRQLSEEITAAFKATETTGPAHEQLREAVARRLAGAEGKRRARWHRLFSRDDVTNWRLYESQADDILSTVRRVEGTVHVRRQLMVCEALLRECKEVALDKHNPPESRLAYIAWILDHVSPSPRETTLMQGES
jgi:hypothetical protein